MNEVTHVEGSERQEHHPGREVRKRALESEGYGQPCSTEHGNERSGAYTENANRGDGDQDDDRDMDHARDKRDEDIVEVGGLECLPREALGPPGEYPTEDQRSEGTENSRHPGRSD